jgi:hypothetical protein
MHQHEHAELAHEGDAVEVPADPDGGFDGVARGAINVVVAAGMKQRARVDVVTDAAAGHSVGSEIGVGEGPEVGLAGSHEATLPDLRNTPRSASA